MTVHEKFRVNDIAAHPGSALSLMSNMMDRLPQRASWTN
jgi:hypothetical protein